MIGTGVGWWSVALFQNTTLTSSATLSLARSKGFSLEGGGGGTQLVSQSAKLHISREPVTTLVQCWEFELTK